MRNKNPMMIKTPPVGCPTVGGSYHFWAFTIDNNVKD